MFDYIPSEIELCIWKFYYNSEIIPQIKLIGIERNNKLIYKSLLPYIIELSVKEKAARIINSIIQKDIIVTSDNIRSLDDMYYNLVNIHNNDMYDIFDL